MHCCDQTCSSGLSTFALLRMIYHKYNCVDLGNHRDVFSLPYFHIGGIGIFGINFSDVLLNSSSQLTGYIHHK